jgi:1,4-dihydroxy-2-naphthoate polyprenyltransferase
MGERPSRIATFRPLTDERANSGLLGHCPSSALKPERSLSDHEYRRSDLIPSIFLPCDENHLNDCRGNEFGFETGRENFGDVSSNRRCYTPLAGTISIMNDTATEISRRKAWLMAARPHTLPAAAAPIIAGVGLALHEGKFAPLPALAAFVGAALIQIGTNFANDYYDAVKGVDTDERTGFTRVTQSGLISPSRVKQAMYGTFLLAILVGVYLVYVGGLPILVIGLASVVSGIAYAGGPFPLGSNGLGDLFVFVFFGVIAVMGTFYVQAAALLSAPFPLGIPAGTVTMQAFLASLPVAAISTNILVVNNIRDLENDRKAGKRTLAVLIGYWASRGEYVGMLALAYLVPVYFVTTPSFALPVLLPLLTIPYAAMVARTVLTKTSGEALNPALEQTGKLLAAYSVCFALGLMV